MPGQDDKAKKGNTPRQLQRTAVSHTKQDCDHQRHDKEDEQEKTRSKKEQNRLKQKRHRERVKAANIQAAEEKRAQRRIYNKRYRDKIKAAKAIEGQTKTECPNIVKCHQTTTPSVSEHKMTSTSPMDFGSPPMSPDGPLAAVPVQLPPHNPDSFSTDASAAVPAGATPPALTNAAVTNPSRDFTVVTTRMRSMMAASPVVKHMNEIEKPSFEQVKAYEHAIVAMMEQVEHDMKLREETFQERREIARNASRAEERRIRACAQAEEQLVMERQEYREDCFAALSDMKQSMALAMLKASTTPMKDTYREANISTNVICPTPERETLKQNANNDLNAFSLQSPVTTPVFSFFSPTTDNSRFQLATGKFSIGVESDKKPPANKYRVKPKTRTPIKSSMASSKNTKLEKYLKRPDHR